MYPYWKGKKRPPRSEEWKRKNREANMGHRVSKETRLKISQSLKGRPAPLRSQETRKKISESKKGEKSRFWKGGITSINENIRHGIDFRLWREAVFARDNWTCQKTGIKGGRLHPHHIQNFADFPELRFAIDNGITLSIQSHIEFHKKYGKKNNNREQIIKFLNTK